MSGFSASGRVATAHASRYLQQTAKHFAHKLPVSADAVHAELTFPKDARGAEWPADALVVLDASDAALTVTITASAAGQRDGLKRAIAEHVDRFAFREAPLAWAWSDL